MLPLRAFFTRSLLLTPHTFWDRTEESEECRAIQWLSMAIPYCGGRDAALTEVPQADGRGLGRFFSGCFWHRIPLESQTDIPSVRSKAC